MKYLYLKLVKTQFFLLLNYRDIGAILLTILFIVIVHSNKIRLVCSSNARYHTRCGVKLLRSN